jgi:hypothetical protein
MSTKTPGLGYAVSEDIGQKRGPNSEFTLFFTVMKGHGAEMRKELEKFGAAVAANADVPFLAGLHESRFCLFNNDTQLLFSTTFDGSINVYVDDAVNRLMPLLHPWLRHLEGYTGTMDTPPSDLSKAKEWFMSYFRKSSVYTRVYARTLPEILKGLKVNDAFQKVLDNPAAAKALQDPALKPLLDQASD